MSEFSTHSTPEDANDDVVDAVAINIYGQEIQPEDASNNPVVDAEVVEEDIVDAEVVEDPNAEIMVWTSEVGESTPDAEGVVDADVPYTADDFVLDGDVDGEQSPTLYTVTTEIADDGSPVIKRTVATEKEEDIYLLLLHKQAERDLQ